MHSQRFFSTRGGDVYGNGALRYRFRQKYQKKEASWKYFGVKINVWVENLTQRRTKSEPFFQKSGHFF